MPSLFATGYTWGGPVVWGQEGVTWGAPDYSDLITSEHADKPNFIAMVVLTTQPMGDLQSALGSLPSLFDIDQAVGQQLDMTGLWIGQKRDLSVPLTGVYFGFGLEGQGFGQGIWRGPFDPTTELDVLGDDDYRTLLKAKIGNNKWNGSIPDAYSFMDGLFPDDVFFIQDNQDMTMWVGLIGSNFSAVTLALLTEGYFDIDPMGITIRGYMTPSVPGSPIFGFGVDNATIGGFGSGVWANVTGRS